MKYSRTAHGLLNAQYRSVLRKCFLINMGLFALGAVATPANAEDYTSQQKVDGTTVSYTSSDTFKNINTPNDMGGAIQIENGATVTVTGSIFENNISGPETLDVPSSYLGGAISSRNSTLTVDGATFTGNKASKGGAIYLANGTTTIKNSTFTQNVGGKMDSAIDLGTSGGPVSLNIIGNTFTSNGSELKPLSVISVNTAGATESANIVVDGNTFKNNLSSAEGVFNVQPGSSTLYTETAFKGTNTFENNTGTGIYQWDNANMTFDKSSKTVLLNNDASVSGNTNGGGIYNKGTMTFEDGAEAEFTGNEAVNGGAVYNQGTMTVGGTFTGNSATQKGGAVYNSGTITIKDGSVFDSNSANYGAGITNYGATASATIGDNVIFKDNYLTGSDKHGSAIYNKSGSVVAGDNLQLTKTELGDTHDCGIYSNEGGDIVIGDNFSVNNFHEAMVIAGNHTLDIGDNMKISNSGKGINLWGSGLVEATVGKNALFENNTGRVFEIKDYASAGSSLTFDDGLVVKDNNLTESGDYFGNVYNSANSEMIFSGSSTFENNTTQRANGNAGVFQNWGKLSFEGDASFDSNAANGVAGAIRNRGEDSNTEFNANVEFTDNKALKDAGAVINEGTMTFAKKANFEGNIAGATVDYVEDENGIYVDTETGQHYSIALGDVDTTSNYNGGAVNNTKDIVFNDEATFTNNKASGLGGAVYNAANGVVDFNGAATFSGNKNGDEQTANDIYNAGTINFNSSADLAGGIDGVAGVVNVNGEGIQVAKALKNQTVNVAGGSELHLNAADVTDSTINLGSDAVLNTINNAVDDYSSITLTNNSNIKVDANLASATMDKFGSTYGQLDLNIVEANMIGSSDEEVTMQLVNDGTKVNTSSVIYEWDDEAQKHTKTGIVGSGDFDGKVKVSNGATVSNLEVAARDTSSAVKESVVYEMGESENFGTETVENATFIVEGNNQSVNVSGKFGVDNKSVVTINDATFNGEGSIDSKGKLRINDSYINVNVNLTDHAILESDPTEYSAKVSVDSTSTATFDEDTFTSTAELANAGTANLSNVTFEDGSKITGNGGTGALNFTNGTTTLGATVANNSLNIKNGSTVELTESGVIDGLNLTNDANNGTIDLRNKKIDTLGSTSLGSNLNVLMDLDLNADKSDTLGTITNNGYGLNLNALELLALGGDEEHIQIATAGTNVVLSSDVTNTLKTYYTNVDYSSADGKLNLTGKQQYASADLVGSWGTENYIKAYSAADAANTSVGANLTILDEQVKTNEDAISAAETAIGGINDDITVATAGNYIAAGTEVANNLTALDTQVKSNANDIDTIESNITVAADGNYIVAGADVKGNLGKLDTQAKANADEIAKRKVTVDATTGIASITDGTNTANVYTKEAAEAIFNEKQTWVDNTLGIVSAHADAVKEQYAGTNYLADATTLTGADKALDTQIKANADAIATKQDALTAGDGITITAATNTIAVNLDTVAETTDKKVMTAAERTKLSGIETGAQVNTIEGVQVNGADLTPDANKKVNVTIAEGSANGTIKVNGTDVAVHGLDSAAYAKTTDFDAAGTAAAAETAAKSYTDTSIAGLDAEVSQTAGSDGLALSITEVDGKITAISGSIAANTYDTYGAANTAETNAKGYTDTKIAQEVTDRNSAISTAVSAEATARQTADTTLQTNIDTEKTLRTAADTVLQANIDAEKALREAADTTLQANINNEKSLREAADNTLQANINNEKSLREAADNTLQTNINNEATARQTADTTLQTNIDNEATARQTADATLQGNIDAEATARQTADATLQTNIDAEATARQTADATLQGNIDAETARAQGVEAAIDAKFTNGTVDAKFKSLNINDKMVVLDDGTISTDGALNVAGIASLNGGINVNNKFGVDANGNLGTDGTLLAKGLASLNGGINVNNKFTVDADGNLVAASMKIGDKDVATEEYVDTATTIATAGTSSAGIAVGDSILAAAGKLDGALKTAEDDIDTIESNITVAADGNYIVAGADVKGNLGKLDTQAKANADEIAKRKVTVDATTGIASITDGTNTANVYTKEAAEAIFNEKQTWVDNTLGIVSAHADAVKEQYASTNYLKDATTLTGADKLLDAQIKANADQNTTQDTALANLYTAVNGGTYNPADGSVTGAATLSGFTATNLTAAANELLTDITVTADGNYITAGADVKGNLSALDGQVKDNADNIASTMALVGTTSAPKTGHGILAGKTITGTAGTDNLNMVDAIDFVAANAAGLNVDNVYSGKNTFGTTSGSQVIIDNGGNLTVNHDLTIGKANAISSTATGKLDMGGNTLLNVQGLTLTDGSGHTATLAATENGINTGNADLDVGTGALKSQTLYVGTTDQFSVDGSGNVSTSGTLDVTGKATVGSLDIGTTGKGFDATGNLTAGTINATGIDTTTANTVKLGGTGFTTAVTGDMTVSGTTTLTDLTVTGDTTLDDLTVNGNTSLKNTTVDGTLEVTGGAIFGDKTDQFVDITDGAITVHDGTGSANITASIANNGNITTKGALEVAGLASLNGGINVNDQFEVSGTDGTVTLTNGTNTASIAMTDVKVATDDPLNPEPVTNVMKVTGTGLFTGDVVSESGFTIAQKNGVDQYEVKFSVNEDGDIDTLGTLSVADDKFTVDGSGNMYAAGDADIDGDLSVGNKFSVTSADGSFSAAGGEFKVDGDGNTKIKGAMAAGKTGTEFKVGLSGNISAASGNFTVDKDGNVTAQGDLGVQGTSWLKNTNVDGALAVTGDTTVGQNFAVAGNSYLHNTSVDGALAVTGTSWLKNTNVDGALAVSGDSTVGQNFAVAGTSYLHNTVVNGDMAVSGTTKTTALTFDGESYVAAMDQGDAAITNGTVDDQAKRTMATNATVAKTIGNLAALENTHGVTSVADVASAIDSLATNVETATGGTFTNNVWKGTVTMAANPDYTYNGATGHANIMAFVNDLASNIGAETAAAKGNIAKNKTVNANLDALDEAIGDRSNLGSANEAINQGTKTSVAAGMRAVGDAIGDMNFAGSHYVAGNNDLSGAVRSLDSNLYRVESDLRDLRRDFRRGMASMSAMSALVPNPRAHGNTSLAIGTGAYDGHTAAAIGGFHYLTDNIMLNAGVAWGNSSDAAYRMGVTFSW